ncbi:TetR/AcrR family transcriptional regulator [Pseudonocardiaceae bacterium YIM PH 21723]|nr:TetR/AcrR family transcriptional regulator [Pseudonocardiaceae bacterium YIM PH 21723]
MDTVIEWTPKARAVLAAADALFYAHGIHAVGVDLIAERAGVTKKTLYGRFGSKERLVVEYLRARDHRWRAFLDPILAAAGEEPAERLRAVFDASARWAAEHSGKGCSMINAHAEISDPAHPAYEVIVGQKTWMLRLFTDIAAGTTDPSATARGIMLLHEGALVSDGMHTFDEAYAHACAVAVRLLALPISSPV